MELIGINVAVIMVTISIIISGILIGAGKALSYKNVERFGVEELFHSILNAAIVGSAVVIVEAIKTTSSSLITPLCSQGDVIAELSCVLQQTSNEVFSLFQEISKTLITIGYYQTLELQFGTFGIQPFANLSGISSVLSSQLGLLNILLILINLNLQIVTFFSQNALALFFPLGLIFRSFFATRRIGGFLIALAFGLYIFYPSFVLVFPTPVNEINITKITLQSFNNNTAYTIMPILDLNNNNAIAEKLDNMSFKILSQTTTNSSNVTVNTTSTAAQKDFTGELTYLTQATSNTISNIMLYAVFAPLLSFIITLVFIKEIANVLGGEVGFPLGVV